MPAYTHTREIKRRLFLETYHMNDCRGRGSLSEKIPSWSEDDALNQKLCTFTKTQKEFVGQHWYYCYTCDMVDGFGVCAICAKVCHKDHALQYAKFSRFYCDCGAQEDASCMALWKRTSPISVNTSKAMAIIPGTDNACKGTPTGDVATSQAAVKEPEVINCVDCIDERDIMKLIYENPDLPQMDKKLIRHVSAYLSRQKNHVWGNAQFDLIGQHINVVFKAGSGANRFIAGHDEKYQCYASCKKEGLRMIAEKRATQICDGVKYIVAFAGVFVDVAASIKAIRN